MTLQKPSLLVLVRVKRPSVKKVAIERLGIQRVDARVCVGGKEQMSVGVDGSARCRRPLPHSVSSYSHSSRLLYILCGGRFALHNTQRGKLTL